MAMGPEFEIYRDRRAPYIPDGDFQFVDRVMRLKGTRGDLSPARRWSPSTTRPADAWYYSENSLPAMPNCVYMESSLQAAILLGYYLGATLSRPTEQYAIRNLGGRRHRVRTSTCAARPSASTRRCCRPVRCSGTVLQNFSLRPLRRRRALLHRRVAVRLLQRRGPRQPGRPGQRPYVAALAGPSTTPRRDAHRLRSSAAAAPTRPPAVVPSRGHLALVDEVDVVDGGGRHGAGYLHGVRRDRPDDWFFACHFHRDPVMPGSLGVEAVIQAMQDLRDRRRASPTACTSPASRCPWASVNWKYRGQILRHDGS